MKRIVWTFGLIAGGILSVMMIVTLPFEKEFESSALVIGYTTMVLSFLSIYFGIRTYRDKASRRVGFGRAFGVGVLIAFIASCCYVATWEVISRKFMPDFPAKYEAATIKHLQEGGKSQAEIDAGIAKAKQFTVMYKNPLFNIAMTFIEPMPVGLVIALISAGVLTRKRRERSPSLESQAAG
jgi:uncharacterized protein DUF4199